MALSVLALLACLAAWVLCLYRSMVTSIRLYADKHAVLVAEHDLDAGGTFGRRLNDDEIHRPRYLGLLARRTANHRVYTVVTLVPETGRATGKVEVAIKLGQQTVGFFSNGNARRFRIAQKKNGWPDQGVTCPAAIIGRYTKKYGLLLDLPAIA